MAQFARTQPQGLLRANRSNPYGARLHWAATSTAFVGNPPLANLTRVRGAGPFGLYTAGGNGGQIQTTASAPILPGRAGNNGDPNAVNLTFIIVASNVGDGFIYDGQETGGQGASLKRSSGNLVYNDGTAQLISVPWPSTAKVAIFHTGVYNVSGAQAWFDGIPGGTASVDTAGHWQATPAFRSFFGSTPYPNNNVFVGQGYAVIILRGLVTQDDVNRLTANPWQVFDAPSQTQFPRAAAATSTGAALSGTAAAVASATGSLTTSISLAASAVVVASTSASLSTQIALAGAAAAQAAASGSPTTQIRLAGSAGAVTASSGALSTQTALAGTAASAATAAGSLSTQIAMAGTAAASSSATGALTAGTGLSGSASASAAAAGALSTSIRLAGSASCSSSASGDLSITPVGAALSGAAAATSTASGSLTTAIKLAGAAVAQASAAGSLSGQVAALSGAALSSSSAAGSLSTQIVVAGAAQAVASAVSSLATAIRLAGTAACRSSATGSLSTGLLPPVPNPHRMIIVPRRKRHFVARHRVRHFEVGR